MRELFLIDPNVIFLNHGSFGACPREVFEEYQRWQREMERQPVEFLGRRLDHLLNDAREKLAAYLGAVADNLIFTPNASAGINIVARSLALEAGDEILTTNHEYGAMDALWAHVCNKAGATYRRQPIPLPLTSAHDFVEQLWAGVTPRTKLIFLSHITSPTALLFPIEPIIQRAREHGILTCIDGAHAPGHIPLALEALGADFYAGNCHKWLCAPKGAAFLVARPEHHAWLEPQVISWGEKAPERTLVNRHQWQGTRDVSPYLTLPAAIKFQETRHWGEVRTRCHEMARAMRGKLADLTGLEPIAPDSPDYFRQMVAAALPPQLDLEAVTALQQRLYNEYHIEVPMTVLDGHYFIRVSFQGYNTPAEAAALLAALHTLLPARG